VSSLGTQTASLALTLTTLAVTGSPARAGVVGFAAGLPALLLQLPAGALVDRWDRRRVMIWCDVGRLLATASIPVVGLVAGLGFTQLLVVAVVNAALGVLYALASSAALPRVVAPEDLPRAISRTQAGAQAALLGGQPLGGWLYGLAPLLPFTVDAASFLVSCLTLTRVRGDLDPEPASVVRGARLRALGSEIVEGLRYVWRQPVLRAVALLSAATTLACGGFTLAVTVLLTARGASPGGIGTVFGCCGAAGLAGAALTPRLIDRLGPRCCFVSGLAVSAALALVLTTAGGPVAIGLCAAGIVAAGPLAGVVLQVARARMVPARVYGRVRAAETTIAGSTAPLSSLLTGLALSRLGPGVTCAVIGGALAVTTLVAVVSPGVRRLGDGTG
jgi:predicted MFS family arabinose efflux permease